MLDANLKTQLQAYLERLTRPVHLVASLDDSAGSQEMLSLLQDIEGLSPKVSLEVVRDDDQRKPSFAITSPELEHLRDALKTEFGNWLGPQDRQKWQPHITIQNRVSKTGADSLFRSSTDKDYPPRFSKPCSGW